MIDIIKYGEFKPVGKQKKKRQIILAHTSRNINDYLQSLKFRFNGNFKRIPNYIITREGKIIQLLGNTEHSEYFKDPNINRNSIIISLENLGWLQKEPLTDHYINWIGDIYKGEVFKKKWRDYFFWQPYTETQIENLGLLCKELFEIGNIKPQIIEHNTKINGIEKYCGVVTKSNFSIDYTDVSPAFEFNELLKNIENEQFAR
jgi:N-acetyl-anhydromuramyl-L-alanine amidase AmpD